MYDMITERVRITGEFSPVLKDPKREAFWEMLYLLAFHDYLPKQDLRDLSFQYEDFSSRYAECTVRSGLAYLCSVSAQSIAVPC
jgi:hypothetical protein